MVECERIPYMSLIDWLVYNLRIYATEGGGSEALWLAATLLGDYAWDKIMKYEIDGKPLIKHLLKCIKDPFIRDEDEWDEYLRCVEEKLEPLLKELEPNLRKFMRALEESVKKLEI